MEKIKAEISLDGEAELDRFYMSEAMKEARIAESEGEVPVGAVIVRDGEIIGRGHNTREYGKNALGHAEIAAIDQACKRLGGWRLTGCTLYVTLEPCPMCAGAIVNSRIERVVYGCADSVAGCCGSVLDLNAYPFNHAFKVDSRVFEQEARDLLKRFFEQRRKRETK